MKLNDYQKLGLSLVCLLSSICGINSLFPFRNVIVLLDTTYCPQSTNTIPSSQAVVYLSDLNISGQNCLQELKVTHLQTEKQTCPQSIGIYQN